MMTRPSISITVHFIEESKIQESLVTPKVTHQVEGRSNSMLLTTNLLSK